MSNIVAFINFLLYNALMKTRGEPACAGGERIVAEGLAFDDVLVRPAYSEVLPRDVVLKTQLTRKIQINIPLVSAAMDTVTESSLAIALARVGGIGIIHKNMTIAEQASQVRKVKRAEQGMIADPVIIGPDNTITDALFLMKENSIGGIPVVNENRELLSIITNRDVRGESNLSKKISDIMKERSKVITAKVGISLEEAAVILDEHGIEKLPLVNDENILTGLITYKDLRRAINNPNRVVDAEGRLLVGAAVGVTAETIDRINALVEAGVDVICIDTAHGHSAGVLKEVKKIKQTFPDMQIIAGNVATGDAAKALVEAGVDAVKVGVGPGSICTTRIIAGIGMPQFSAIMECADAISGSGVPIIADGGIRYSGDMVKALAAGASCVMAGGLFAGTEESPGETVLLDGRKFKTYRGMGSIEAMKDGSKDRYFQDKEEELAKLVPEGIGGIIPFKSSLAEVVYQFVGGLRAGMGYSGSSTIKDLWNAEFVKITSAGMKESHPHDVTITKEAPNYSKN